MKSKECKKVIQLGIEINNRLISKENSDELCRCASFNPHYLFKIKNTSGILKQAALLYVC